MKTATAKGSHNQSAINPFEVCRAKCNRVCVEKGRGMQRGVAISVASQRIDKLHTKLDSKIGICVEKFHAQRGPRGEKGRAGEWQIYQLGQLIKRKVLPATHVYHSACVCLFCNPCQSWHILQRQTEIGCSRSRRRFLYGICMVCTHTHTYTEVHRGTQSHRQWKGASEQAAANWLHCLIWRVLIANDLLSTETRKVLPIEDLLDKPKQTRTKRPKPMDSLSLSVSLSVSLRREWPATQSDYATNCRPFR